MPENMMNSAHKGSNQASRAGYDQTKWDGGKAEPRPAGPPKEVQYIRCPKCSYKRMALIERCPVCKE